MGSPKPPEIPAPAASPSPNGRSAGAGAAASRLVMLTQPRSAAAEAYRTLSVNLQFSGVDHPVQTIGFTSGGAAEGKSSTVANLGVAMAEGGHRVIVVDADLRRPGLHRLFGLSDREGLSTALLAQDAPLPLQDTLIPGLRVLTSGPIPPNPTGLLASRRLDRLVARLAEQADFVLFDTAPVGVLADTAILAPRLDGVVLVVAVGQTRRDAARQAKEHLQRVQARILGVVLTGTRPNSKPYA